MHALNFEYPQIPFPPEDCPWKNTPIDISMKQYSQHLNCPNQLAHGPVLGQTLDLFRDLQVIAKLKQIHDSNAQ